MERLKQILPESMVHYIGQWYLIAKSPIASSRLLLHDINQDYLAVRGKVNYPTPLILVIGLPKSGTSWLEQLLNEVPGYIQLNNSVLRNFSGKRLLNNAHDVSREMLASCPQNRYSYLKLHTHFSQANIDIINEFGIRPIVMIRDIRDMMISRYHHNMNEPEHWMYPTLRDMPPEEGFLRSMFDIDGIKGFDPIDYFVRWIEDWLAYERDNPGSVCVVRYEDMKLDVNATLQRLLSFVGIDFDAATIANIVKRQEHAYRNINKSSLKQKFKNRGRLRSTLRKGQVGEWAEFFTPEHKELFKEKAGHTLIASGYEKDLSW